MLNKHCGMVYSVSLYVCIFLCTYRLLSYVQDTPNIRHPTQALIDDHSTVHTDISFYELLTIPPTQYDKYLTDTLYHQASIEVNIYFRKGYPFLYNPEFLRLPVTSIVPPDRLLQLMLVAELNDRWHVGIHDLMFFHNIIAVDELS